jgi:hypothetical protein
VGATITVGGDFSWMPTAGQVGEHTIVVIAIDSGTPALADAETFTVIVNPAGSQAPVVDLNGDDTGNDATATYTEDDDPTLIASAGLTITDSDSTTLTGGTVAITNLLDGDSESLSADTSGTSITADYDSSTGVLTLTGEESIANYQQVLRTLTYHNSSQDPNTTARSVEVTVSDGLNDSITRTSVVSVMAVNDDPDLAGVDDQNAVIGQELTVSVTATDVDTSQTLTFTLDVDNSPANATIDKTSATTALIRWTPEASDLPGPVNFRVLVTDDGDPELSDSQNFLANIDEANVSPDLAPIPEQSATIGQELVVSISATDANLGQMLTFFLDPETAPSTATIENNGDRTATIRWTPEETDLPGPIAFGVLVTDDGVPALVDNETFSVALTGVSDSDPPEVSSVPTGTLTNAISSFAVVFDEEMGATAFNVANYSLTVVGGPDDGDPIAISSVTTVDNLTATIALAAGLPDGSYRLTLDDSVITDAAGNLLTGTTVFEFAVAVPAALAAIAPLNGSTNVRLTRDLRVDLTEPIDPSTVNSNSFYAMAGGQKVAGMLRVGSDSRSISLFPSSPLPASTRVRLVVDGDAIMGLDGRALDANGDGVPGGKRHVEFTTGGLTRLQGTGIFGYVFDSTRSTEDTKVPIVGLTIRAEGLPDLYAVTDENGYFFLENTPGTEFYAVLDASTATNAPDGFHYVGTSKPFHPVPGMVTPLGKADGRMFDIYLPLSKDGEAISITPGEMTMAKFSESTLDNLASITPEVSREMWEKLAVEVPPDSLFYDDGTPATEVQIFALEKNRVPAPLPVGDEPAIVFSVAAGGADNFDVPAKVVYPNINGLAPGEKRNIFSFDHDAGAWVPTGTMTVSEDGSVLVSDTGVQTVGWRYVGPEPENWTGGDEPRGNKPADSDTKSAEVRLSVSGDSDEISRTFMPPEGPKTQPGEHKKPNGPTPYTSVLISIDGPFAQFYDTSGGLTTDQFVLTQGDNPVTLTASLKSLQKILQDNHSGKPFDHDVLYGAKLTIITEVVDSSGTKTTDKEFIYPYLLVDQSDSNATDKALSFSDTVHAGNISRARDIHANTGSAPLPNYIFSTTNSEFSQSGANISFNPAQAGMRNATLSLEVVDEGLTTRSSASATISGTGTASTTLYLNSSDAIAALMSLGISTTMANTLYSGMRAELQNAFINTLGNDAASVFGISDASMGSAGDRKIEVLWNVADDEFIDLNGDGKPQSNEVGDADGDGAPEVPGDYIDLNGNNMPDSGEFFGQTASDVTGDGIISAGDFIDLNKNGRLDFDGLLGRAFTGVDFNGTTDFGDRLVTHEADYGKSQEAFIFDQMFDQSKQGMFELMVDNIIGSRSIAQAAVHAAVVVAHEAFHTLGLVHSDNMGIGSHDILNHTAPPANRLTTSSKLAIRAALDLPYAAQDLVDNALKAYRSGYSKRGARPAAFPANLFDEPITKAGPRLSVLLEDSDLTPLLDTYDLGAVPADGIEGEYISTSARLYNTGDEDLEIQEISIEGNGVRLDGISAGAVISPNESVAVQIVYDPSVAQLLNGQVLIRTNATGPQDEQAPVIDLYDSSGHEHGFDIGAEPPDGVYRLLLSGRGLRNQPVLALALHRNNVGGAALGSTLQEAGTLEITNEGGRELTVAIDVLQGMQDFRIANGVESQLVLGPLETIEIPVLFTPSAVGLRRGTISLQTNDPEQATRTATIVGTGILDHNIGVDDYDWGKDYAVLDNNGFSQRVITNDAGGFELGAPVDADYFFSVFDPESGLIASINGVTGPAGAFTDITSALTFRASTAPDTDGDGLPDDIEFAIGTGTNSTDSDNDGLDDFREIEQGLNPLDGVTYPKGVVASVALQGEAREVFLEGSTTQSADQTAFIATGNHGLAIVDASDFTMPILLSEIDLPGVSTDVVASTSQEFAAVAAGVVGVHIVDVSDPLMPELLRTISLPSPATRLELFGGVLYVAGNDLSVIDPVTGDILQELDLGARVVDLSREGETLAVITSDNKLHVVDLSSGDALLRGSVEVSDGVGRVFLANGIAYIADGREARLVVGPRPELPAGYSTVDIASDPDAPALLSGVDTPIVQSGNRQTVLNGSGLAIVAAGFRGLQVHNAADPETTYALLPPEYPTPGSAESVAIGGGIAYVADGNGGLQVINYLDFDIDGVPPEISISDDAIDADPETAGIQVIEGERFTIIPAITDDVQVRNAELLVNGLVVANDVQFPFEFSVIAPNITADRDSVSVQVRATDTGGNSTVSNTLQFQLIEDTIPPSILKTTPNADQRVFFTPSISISFDESLDPEVFDLAAVSLTNLGQDGSAGGGDDVIVPVDSFEFRSRDRQLVLFPGEPLDTGLHQLVIASTAIADRPGNLLASDFTLEFTIRDASHIQAESGTPRILRAPSANPGQVIELDFAGVVGDEPLIVPVADQSGNISTRSVAPIAFDAEKGALSYVIPEDAVTGDVEVQGVVGSLLPLQIVPVLTGIDITSVSGSNFSATLSGRGFIENNETEYTLGGETFLDDTSSINVFTNNTQVNLSNLPFSDDLFGAATVTTAGGTSAPLVFDFTAIDAVALSGTPADAGEASANAGQAITIAGTGLSTTSDFIGRYLDNSGNEQLVLLNPIAVNQVGTEATLLVPEYFNGVFEIARFGSTDKHLLQIVPTVSDVGVYTTNAVRLIGSGFVEGDGVIDFNGTVVNDTDVSSSPIDVTSNTVGNQRVNLSSPPLLGSGQLTVSSAGGTSAPFAYNFVNPNLSTVYAVEQAGNGDLFVIAGSQVQRIDADGQLLQAYNSISTSWGGLDLLTEAITLLDSGSSTPVNLPAGTLLVFKSNGVVDALDTSTDTVLASLTPTPGIDAIGGIYHPTIGTLFFLDYTPNEVVEINPTTGEEVNRFTPPITVSDGGLTLDPASGNLLIAGNSNNLLAELQSDGTLVQTVDLTSQGISNEISGLDFLGGGQLLASSTLGVIYQLNIDASPTPSVLTGITSVAYDGMPTDAGEASAHVGQLIEITGTNLTRATQVVFPTLDNNGVAGTTNVTVLGVSDDGTRAQVVVPDQATTGELMVLDGTGSALLQVVPLITGLSGSGRPGGVNSNNFSNINSFFFDLAGSGFIEGASTITIGGKVIEDLFTNLSVYDVSGNRNSSYRMEVPLAVEGPITITTAGGSFTYDLPLASSTAFSTFEGIVTTATAGTPADVGVASANAGQTIRLIGQGFTSTTLVQFEAVDDEGTAGVITRDGTASFDGTTLDVVVPTLAKTGTMRVLGAADTHPLQVVPVVRSIGGTIAEGETLLIDGSGLVEGQVTVTVDGQAATVVNSIAVADSVGSNRLAQQLLEVTLPAGVNDASSVVVTNSGGTFTITRQAPTVLTDLTPASDPADTLATALAVDLPTNNQQSITGRIGEVGSTANTTDVDLYELTLSDGDRLTADIASGFTLRLFNDLGELVSPASSTGAQWTWQIDDGGTYYLGVSRGTLGSYNPTVANSMNRSESPGDYVLGVERSVAAAGTHRLDSIGATAVSGTPRVIGVASANSGQTITLTGTGFLPGDRVVFTVDASGGFVEQVASAASVTETQIEVVVPNNAVTGTVRLQRETTGLLLQIVPVILDIEQGATESFHAGSLRLTGSGFLEGGIAVAFGASTLRDPSGSSTDVRVSSSALDLTVPNGVPYGPITVSTLGGTSAAFGLTLDRIVDGVATSGTPADAMQASANPGQVLDLEGSGFDPSTDVVFRTIDQSGIQRETVVRPTAVTSDGTRMSIVVPAEAMTGTLSIVGDQNNSEIPLQIVPVLTAIDLTNISNDTFSATLSGRGFIEGNGTEYTLGGVTFTDDTTSINVFTNNTQANFSNLPFSDDLFGAATVTTAGGTSAPLAFDFSGITSVALSGTPVDMNEASANAGQAITVTGTGLTTDSDFIGRYLDNSANEQLLLLNPIAANLAGTEATIVVPEYFNGVFEIARFGSSQTHLLQIVPTIESITGSGGASGQILGSGFVEGGGSIYESGDGTMVTDDDVSSSPIDVTSNTNQNQRVDLGELPAGPLDGFRVTTTGGTSAPFVESVTPMSATLVGITSVAYDGMPTDAGEASAHVGQVIEIAGTNLTRATQVVFPTRDNEGNESIEAVTVLGVSDDGMRAHVIVPDLATTGELTVVDGTGSALLQVVPLITGLSGGRPGGLFSSFNNINSFFFDLAGSGFMEGASTITIGGKVIEDLFTNLSVYDVSGNRNSTYRMEVPLAVEGPITITTAGGSFTYDLPLASSTAFSTFEGIDTTATAGTPANVGIASVNAGQTIRLIGQGFTSTTLVQFEAVDDEGTAGVIARTGSAGNAGTTLDVVVPTVAKTGTLRVLGAADTHQLQVVPVVRSIGGTVAAGQTLLIDGSGFVEGEVTVTIDGQVATIVNSIAVADSTSSSRLAQQLLEVILPAGVNDASSVVVTTSGGSFTLLSSSRDLDAVSATLGSGTARITNVIAANVGQSLILTGSNFLSTDRIIFLISDTNGTLFEQTLTPTSITETEIEVAVPENAVTGTVRLQRETTGLLLQIVPVITDLDQGVNASYHNGSLTLSGSGFADGGMTIDFGGQPLVDPSGSSSVVDVFNFGNNETNVTVPNGVPYGPITVSTLGGTSAAFGLTLDRIVDGVATSGTPADAMQASANPGQVLDLEGSGLDPSTDVVFRTIDQSGVQRETVVRPTAVTPDGTRMSIVVPAEAMAGTLSIVGDQNNAEIPLQIVPVLSGLNVTSVSGSNFSATLSGRGFIEGNGTEYTLGGVTFTDDTTSINVFTNNTGVNFSNLPFGDDLFGAATVTTAGGTSAPLAFDFSGIDSVALSGTPADAGKASANAGEAITIVGTGLTTASDFVGRYLDNSGNEQFLLLNPITANLAGTEATIVVPEYFNGVFEIARFGSSEKHLLQIVPTIESITGSGGASGQILGSGFVEGGGSVYKSGDGTEVVDDDVSSSPIDVTSSSGQNRRVNLALPAGGVDGFTVTTAGGTSAAFVADVTPQPAVLNGITSVAYDGTPTDAGEASAHVGQVIEITGTNLTRATQVVFPTRDNEGNESIEAVTVLGVSDDGMRAQVIVPDLATTDELMVLDGTGSALLQVVPLITGLSGSGRPGGATSPFPFSSNSFTFDLVGSGFMEGASTITIGGTVIEDLFTNLSVNDVTGTRNSSYRMEVPLAVEGPITIATAGGSFTYDLPLASSTVFSTFEGIDTTAAAGTSANVGIASANAGQTIRLVGQGLSSSTLVQFEAVDDQGIAGVITRTGTASFAGTTLDMVVPTLAKTGTIRVLGAADTHQLQVVPVVRSIGGTIAEGETLLIDGSGFVEGEVTVNIDGQAATVVNSIAVADSIGSNRLAQQLLEVTLPAGVNDASSVVVTTSGGTFTITRQAPMVLADLAPVTDPADTIAMALAVDLPTNNQQSITGRIGEVGSMSSTRDVDLYEIVLNAGDQLTADIGTGFTLRLFNDLGELVSPASSTGAQWTWQIDDGGTYYLGVSRGTLGSYNPTMANSMNRSESPGDYVLGVERSVAAAGTHRLDSIGATTVSGTPRVIGVASANSGQTITLSGTGFLPGDRVVFLVDDTNGTVFEQTLTPTSITETVVEVVVPNNAVTGTVRLQRETTGLLLQIVPTLTSVSSGGSAISGSGFVEGGISIHFGDSITLPDPSPSSSVVDIRNSFTSNTTITTISLTVPLGVPTDDIWISTLGGLSARLPQIAALIAQEDGAAPTIDAIDAAFEAERESAQFSDSLPNASESVESELDLVFGGDSEWSLLD